MSIVNSEIDRRAAIQTALSLWSAGNQAGAVDAIRHWADLGDASSLHLICWFLHQMGDRWREGVPYAERAVAIGLPNVANYYWGNMLNDPQFNVRAVALIRGSILAGSPIDPVGNSVQIFQQGQRDAAVDLVEAGAR